MKLLKFFYAGLVFFLWTSAAHCTPFLTDLHGHNIPFDSLKGKWVLINYWAGWCQPCLDEISELNAFYQNHQDKVALFAVNFDDMPAEAQLNMMEKLNIQYPGLLKNPQRQLGLKDVRGVPATFVFNPEGKHVDTLYGGQTLASLDKAVSMN